MADVKRTFKQVGDKVIVKNIVEDTALSPKEVINSIEDIKANINSKMEEVGKATQQINQMTEDIKTVEEKQLPQMEKDLKDISKFGEWALKYQRSKLDNLIEEVKEECFVKVTAAYKEDKALTSEGNDLQKFKQFQHKVATHPKISEGISQKLINDLIFIDCILDNPWK